VLRRLARLHANPPAALALAGTRRQPTSGSRSLAGTQPVSCYASTTPTSRPPPTPQEGGTNRTALFRCLRAEGPERLCTPETLRTVA
jgi:hypothetical protein